MGGTVCDEIATFQRLGCINGTKRDTINKAEVESKPMVCHPVEECLELEERAISV